MSAAYPDRIDELFEFYRRALGREILPFWRRAWDTELGGVYTCFSNDGSRLLGTDKYVWSQGRFLWLLSRLVRMIRAEVLQESDGDQDDVTVSAVEYLEQARKTCRFLLEHAVLEPGEGVCPFLLTREGLKKESVPGAGFYTSFYVDCFVILGLSEFALAAGDQEPLDRALELYDRSIAFMADHGVVSEPYPVPPGFLSHSVPMILCDTAFGLSEALLRSRHPRGGEVRAESVRYAEAVLTRHYDQETGLLRETMPLDCGNEDTLLARHFNPGHAVESMWFCGRVLEAEGGNAKLMERAASVAANAVETGWDDLAGGIVRFCDRAGGEPSGRLLDVPYERQVRETWDTKLWWVHSEALYASMFFYVKTGEARFWELNRRLGGYVFSTFPNPDREVGEWIQIRDRAGKPLEKTVALPVKDPYHIMRNFMLILELLSTER